MMKKLIAWIYKTIVNEIYVPDDARLTVHETRAVFSYHRGSRLVVAQYHTKK